MQLPGTAFVVVAEKERRILDRWIGTNLLERSVTHNRDPGVCVIQQQQDRPALGQGKGGHPSSILAGRRQVCRDPAIRDDPIAQRSRVRRHHDLGADAEDAARGAGRIVAAAVNPI